MDEYAELQFIERNAATVTQSDPRHAGQVVRPGQRTFVPARYGSQPHVVYAQAPGLGGGSLFGRMTPGQMIDMVAQIFAALMPLPAAPVSTSDTATDVGNLMTYQSSLAQYAKRDEQVRTLGNLVTKLVG